MKGRINKTTSKSFKSSTSSILLMTSSSFSSGSFVIIVPTTVQPPSFNTPIAFLTTSGYSSALKGNGLPGIMIFINLGLPVSIPTSMKLFLPILTYSLPIFSANFGFVIVHAAVTKSTPTFPPYLEDNLCTFSNNSNTFSSLGIRVFEPYLKKSSECRPIFFAPYSKFNFVSFNIVSIGIDLNFNKVGVQNLHPLPHPLVISTSPLIDGVIMGGISFASIGIP